MKIPRIGRVAIVGAGTMGPKIAYRCVVHGIECRLYDQSAQALAKAMDQIEQWLKEGLEQGRLTPDKAREARTNLEPAPTLAQCVARADLVIETVPENIELKRRVFSEIDGLAPQEALIATNSSSLPCSRMAEATTRPEKVLNINFADPVHDFEVEIMKGSQTADQTLVAVERFCRAMEMVPIVTMKEIMGFSFNRIWRAVKRESLHLVDQGFSRFEEIDRAWILVFGTDFGPFGLMDMVGLDVVRDIEEQYYLDSGQERDRPPKLLDRMIAQGRLGVKSGQGFYSYPDPDYRNPAWLHKKPPFDENLARVLGLKEE